LLYANNPEEQHTYIKAAQKKNYKVLKFDGPIDTHFINHLEQQLDNVSFTRVDADTIDNLIDKGKEKKSDLSEDQQKQLKDILQKQVVDSETANIQFSALSKDDHPIMITKPEFNRRMKDMAATSGMTQMQNMPDQFNVVVNTNHSLITNALLESDSDKQRKKLQQAYDLARLSQNMLKGEELSKFMKRSVDLIK
jgi:molecular chaperone HtpG